MIRGTFDVIVLGAGFGGSLTALVLHQSGLRCALLDRQSHPRFAIGESTTPIADQVLRGLARQYRLPRLEPLTRYGTWLATYPQVECGLKRGFSYFQHRPGECFQPDACHSRSLLVTASADDERADTHWLRSSVDQFFAQEAVDLGVPYWDQASVEVARSPAGWRVTGSRHGESLDLGARFLVDATGDHGIVRRALHVPDERHRLRTRSRGLFSHFRHLTPWRDELLALGDAVDAHPFCCDHAAVHQLVDEGWMWQLRFRGGITSAGFALECDAEGVPEQPADAEWASLLARYPSLSRQFAATRIVDPPARLLQTFRMQRLAATSAGPGWALLPNTAGFIDPLHSTGIAQTLCGIERLADLLCRNWDQPALEPALEHYAAGLRSEFFLVDAIVSAGYRSRRIFPAFASVAMLYFAAVTTYERKRAAGVSGPGCAFLGADDPDLVRMVTDVAAEVDALGAAGVPPESQVSRFQDYVAAAVRPYNQVGLCDAAAHNMYRHTAAPECLSEKHVRSKNFLY